ncbi:Lhr family helicase, partial [Georgenia yuyongxinii]|uniref:Lhr family helicase n=1 Tax=Georgenia yuyongxinii TaxID=2589797 RepID=UPI003AF703F2
PATAAALPAAAGRWSLVRPAAPDAGPGDDGEARTAKVTAQTVALLERHGVLVRGAAGLEELPGGFGAAYQVLRRLEESGQVRRGYLVEGLGAAQFALPEVVDRLRGDAADLTARRERAAAGTAQPRVVLLAATDPANPYGAALGWPPTTAGEGHRPGRKAGAAVVLADGTLTLYVERGGRTLLSFTSDPMLLGPAAGGLAEMARTGALGPLTLGRVDGVAALETSGPLRQALDAAGFGPTPRGLRLRTAHQSHG